jgi:multidrug resistance efflux pump
MTNTEPQPQPAEPDGATPPPADPPAAQPAAPAPAATSRPARAFPRFLRVMITLVAVAIAAVFVVAMWQAYMTTPWTRDGTVRVYVVSMAPEVAGRIVELPVVDNQVVKKGDLLMVIEPTNYEIAVKAAEAALERAKANAIVAQADFQRRERLISAAVSKEEKETFRARWLTAEANLRDAQANLDQARVNLKRTRIYSPVNGYVTNLLAQLADYANVGQRLISVVNSDSFWVDGYFEETNLQRIRAGDPAYVQLMGSRALIKGHVDSIARAINVPNAQPNEQGLAVVNPIFTWVRLAQRIPVRVHIDEVPQGVVLSAGMTATVEINPRGSRRAAETKVADQ